MKTNRNIRIKDIAEMAGVSAGTVDRVIHNRGNVSPSVEKEVKAILEKTGYTPNPVGQSLVKKKDYRIAVIIPCPEQDEYWELADFGISESQKEWESYHLDINLNRFDLYNSESFKEVSDQVLQTEPDAVLTAPVFYDESLAFLQKLKMKHIPYILFNTLVKKINPLCLVGQDLYQSGQLAAELMDIILQKPANIAVMHTHEDIGHSKHLKNKERGFKDYFSENGPNFKVHSFSLLNNHGSLESQINKCIADNRLKGIFVTTSSGAYMTAKVLDDHNKESVALIGYDLLKQNIYYLKRGIINFLINQDPRQQTFKGLRHLAAYLLFNITPPPTDLLPIGVIAKKNYKSFLNDDENG